MWMKNMLLETEERWSFLESGKEFGSIVLCLVEEPVSDEMLSFQVTDV